MCVAHLSLHADRQENTKYYSNTQKTFIISRQEMKQTSSMLSIAKINPVV
jgi:hypothetical protein